MGVFDSIKGAIRERSASGKAEQEEALKEEIFNDAKFIESLDQNPNVGVDSDLETLHTAREAFKIKDKTSAELQKLFKNQLKHDLDLDLDAPGMEQVKGEIETYLKAELIDNPEHISELAAQIKEFNEMQARIKEQEKILISLGSDVDFLKQKGAVIGEIRKSKRLFESVLGPSAQKATAQKKAQQEFGVNITNLDAEFQEVQDKINKGQSAETELQHLRDKFKDLRKSILQDLAPMAALAELARTKAEEKLERLVTLDPDNETLSNLDKARAFFKKMKGGEFDVESGFDYLGNDFDESTFTAALDARLELAVKQDIERAVDKVAGTNTTLKAMLTGLKPFLDRRELGSKDKEATRTFLLDHLRTEVMPTLSKGKQILLGAALARYE